MRFNIKYKGAKGEVDFTKSPLSYQTNDFSDYKREFTSTNRKLGFGTTIDKFQRYGKEYNFTINITGKTRELMYREINRMIDIFEHDVMNENLARLYVNGVYVSGYIVGAKDMNWTLAGNGISSELTFFAVDPFWIQEKNYAYSTVGNISEEEGFILPMGFPMSFTSLQSELQVQNTIGKDNLSKIIFYGPVVNPVIEVGGQTYAVSGELLANERYEIDQRNKTVTKITASGDYFDAFNDRQKSPSVFNPIKNGVHTVVYDKTFSVEIIVYESLVEPQWK